MSKKSQWEYISTFRDTQPQKQIWSPLMIWNGKENSLPVANKSASDVATDDWAPETGSNFFWNILIYRKKKGKYIIHYRNFHINPGEENENIRVYLASKYSWSNYYLPRSHIWHPATSIPWQQTETQALTSNLANV